ncbi:MAG: SET domain-containing protein [Bacteroidales bacterium]|jgi:hypothetical protein|nr:SET domain-containing protein [Bacteroidales bacterium]
MMFDHIDIHEMLLHQIGNSEEISDFRNDSVIISDSSFIQGEKGLIAIDTIPKHSVVFSFKNHITCTRTKTSIQIGNDVHIEPGNFGVFANHSCVPNCYMWTQYRSSSGTGHVVLIATQDIYKGEEFTFDYATTETELSKDLKDTACKCRKFGCRTYLKGFFNLSQKEQESLLSKQIIAPHLDYSKIIH